MLTDHQATDLVDASYSLPDQFSLPFGMAADGREGRGEDQYVVDPAPEE